jgi:hypothetical protein
MAAAGNNAGNVYGLVPAGLYVDLDQPFQKLAPASWPCDTLLVPCLQPTNLENRARRTTHDNNRKQQ